MPFLENIRIFFLIKKKNQMTRVDYVSKVTTRCLSCLICYFLSFDPHNVSGNRQLRRPDRLLWLPFVVFDFLSADDPKKSSDAVWQQGGRERTTGCWQPACLFSLRWDIFLIFFLIPSLCSSVFIPTRSGCCVFRYHSVSNTPSQVGVKFPPSSIRSDIIIIIIV